ncbi:unnamed protein product [Prorocentrum cordatum]|uniref:Uncharacterized protein n=1 Tax=Prorocentrum cordatum TaxID=2364126 RepID=A0ABN9SAK5_9DINO|nr:unnamed protein product [Polarella glacialis]
MRREGQEREEQQEQHSRWISNSRARPAQAHDSTRLMQLAGNQPSAPVRGGGSPETGDQPSSQTPEKPQD